MCVCVCGGGGGRGGGVGLEKSKNKAAIFCEHQTKPKGVTTQMKALDEYILTVLSLELSL